MTAARWWTARVVLVVAALLGLLGMHGLPAHSATAATHAVGHEADHATGTTAAGTDATCADHTACVAIVRPAHQLAPPGVVATAEPPTASHTPVATGASDVPARAPPDRVDLVALGISRT